MHSLYGSYERVKLVQVAGSPHDEHANGSKNDAQLTETCVMESCL